MEVTSMEGDSMEEEVRAVTGGPLQMDRGQLVLDVLPIAGLQMRGKVREDLAEEMERQARRV